MTAEELRKQPNGALYKELLDLRRELFNLRFQKATQPEAVKTNHFKRVKTEIARIKTILHEKRASDE